MLPWQQYIRQLNHQKTKVCVVNLLAAILATEGSRVLKKKVNETQVSKTVFSNLKASRRWLQKFMKINGLSLRRKTSVAQQDPERLVAKVVSYIIQVREL